MDAAALIGSLGRFPALLSAATAGLGDEDARRRGPQGQWSVVEIVAHLGDEEAEDFRRRVELTLADPGQAWPGIDPEGASSSRRYRERTLVGELSRFAAERERSLAWLATLDGADWQRTHTHPTIGPLRAGDLLASWAAHDLLHLRQIVKRRYELVCAAAAPCETGYAGSW
jgi:hypothetical protein